MRKLLRVGLVCALGFAVVSCGGSAAEPDSQAKDTSAAEINAEEISAAEASAEEISAAAATKTGSSEDFDWLSAPTGDQILQKPLGVGVKAEGIEQLIVGSPIDANAIRFRAHNQPAISVQYRLVSKSKAALDSISEKDIFGEIEQNKLTISMPALEGCSITEIDGAIEQLSGVCVLDVAVLLPANQKIAVYDATSYATADNLPFWDLAWPAAVPETVAALTQTIAVDIDEAEYRLLLVDRFIAAGYADSLAARDLDTITRTLSDSAEKLAIVERLADPLKKAYRDRPIDKSDLQPLLDSLEEGDRAKVLSLLS